MSITKDKRPAATRVPPELLLDILANASNKTLRSASLVHPTWRQPSQYLLHCELSLPSRKIAKSYLQVAGRKTYSKKLSLPISLDTEDSWHILEGLQGLEHLTLVCTEGATGKSKFEIDLLEASALSGLTSLRLTAPFSEPVHPASTFVFPFCLSSLSFKGPCDSYPSALLDSLVDSSSHSITSIDLDVYGTNAASTRFFESLVPLAGHLKRVELHGTDRSSPALVAFLTACTSIESFSCWEATPRLLSALAPTVKALEFNKTFFGFHDDLVYDALLTQAHGVLDHVTVIRFSGMSRASLAAQRGGCELLEDLAEKGIETHFGAVSYGHWYGLGLR